MKVVKPSALTVLSSNVPEENYPVWDSAVAYNAGDIVLVENLEPNGITKKFKSLADNNQNHYPPDYPDFWQDFGATNKWAMFDQYSTTQTVNENSIEVEIQGYKLRYLSLFNTEANSVDVYLYNEETDQYELKASKSLRLDSSTSWSEYFFSDFMYVNNVVFFIPNLYNNPKFKIVISGGTCKCGILLAGEAFYLGNTLFDLSTGIKDFSVKEETEFGSFYLKQGKYSWKIDATIEVRTPSLKKVEKVLAELRATPCIWDFNNEGMENDWLILYGFYRDFNINYSNPVVSSCTITIEGLI